MPTPITEADNEKMTCRVALRLAWNEKQNCIQPVIDSDSR
jgi:hypothetical protein